MPPANQSIDGADETPQTSVPHMPTLPLHPAVQCSAGSSPQLLSSPLTQLY